MRNFWKLSIFLAGLGVMGASPSLADVPWAGPGWYVSTAGSLGGPDVLVAGPFSTQEQCMSWRNANNVSDDDGSCNYLNSSPG